MTTMRDNSQQKRQTKKRIVEDLRVSFSFSSVRLLHRICGSFYASRFCVLFSLVFSPFLSRAFGVGCPSGHSKDGLLLEKIMAKKGRAARILNTLHKVNGTKQSEALKRRERKRPSKEFGNTETNNYDEWKTFRVEEKKAKTERYERGERTAQRSNARVSIRRRRF